MVPPDSTQGCEPESLSGGLCKVGKTAPVYWETHYSLEVLSSLKFTQLCSVHPLHTIFTSM